MLYISGCISGRITRITTRIYECASQAGPELRDSFSRQPEEEPSVLCVLKEREGGGRIGGKEGTAVCGRLSREHPEIHTQKERSLTSVL